MSDTFQCGDNTALVSFLYDECEPAERAAVDAHIAVCPACAAEIAALGSARLQLASWIPPDADLGFAITRTQASAHHDSTVVKGPARWFHRPMPVWAQAVAASLIFGVGLSLGLLRGTMPTGSSSTETIAAATTTSPSVTPADLAVLERRLRSEMAGLRAAPVSAPGSTGAATSNAQLLAQVRALIDESEQRQQRELALRTAQVVRDFASQRQVDLARIDQNFGQIENVTGAEVREQREMLNYLLRVSQRQ